VLWCVLSSCWEEGCLCGLDEPYGLDSWKKCPVSRALLIETF
jgi:hypothetical protein